MERCGQRGGKSRYNCVMREGGQWDRKEGRGRCSHFSFSSSEAQAGWLQQRYCLSPPVWRAPQLWVPEETCCYLGLEEEDRPQKLKFHAFSLCEDSPLKRRPCTNVIACKDDFFFSDL